MKKFFAKFYVLVIFLLIFDLFSVKASNNKVLSYSTIKYSESSITISPYVDPTLLYKNQSNQPMVISAVDQYGGYITNLSFTLTYPNEDKVKFTVKEISKGFYRFIVNTENVINQPYISITAYLKTKTGKISSNDLVVKLKDKTMFNPYVDINSTYSTPPYGQGENKIGRKLFDKLPCSIGCAFELEVKYWDVADPQNWHIYKTTPLVNGPINHLINNRYVVEEAGKITCSIEMIAWERIDKNLKKWNSADVSEDEMSVNAKPHVSRQDFDIAAIYSCQVDRISFENGSQIDDTTIVAGKLANLLISVSGINVSADLDCTCASNIFHIYMINSSGETLKNAFTMDTVSNKRETIDEIWYNPKDVLGTNIPELPYKFSSADKSLKIINNCSSITFSNLSINYSNYPFPNKNDDYHLIIQVFTKREIKDGDSHSKITYPMVFEDVDDIVIEPKIKPLNSEVSLSNPEADSILAGTLPEVFFTDPGFTLGQPEWITSFKGKIIDYCSIIKSPEGYKASFNLPLNDKGTLEIFGYAYNSTHTKMETVKIDIPVVMPEFIVQPGLSDESTIDCDGMITEGIPEKLYVFPSDPRGIYDFKNNKDLSLKVVPTKDDNGIISSFLCNFNSTDELSITVAAYSNFNTQNDASFNLYLVSYNTDIYIDTFEIVPPTSNNTKKVTITSPTSAPVIKITIIDSHGHGISNTGIMVSNVTPNTAFNGWYKLLGKTNENGTLECAFNPRKSGKYYFYLQIPLQINNCLSYDIKPVSLGYVTVDYHPSSNKKVIVLQPNNPYMTVNGVQQEIDPGRGTKPVIIPKWGRTVVPIRAIVEALGGTIGWDGKERKVTIKFNDTVIELWIDNPKANVNEETKWIDENNHDVKPIIVNSRTMLPLRFVAESLGCKVDWDGTARTITITYSP